MVGGGVSLDNTWGVLFVTSLVSSMLWGASVVQLYIYYSSFWRSDNALLKAFIFMIWSLDTVILFLVLTGTYEVFVSHFGDFSILLYIDIQFKVLGFFTTTINLLCQIFYIRTIWIMSKQCISLTLACSCLVLAQFILSTVYDIFVLKTRLAAIFEDHSFMKSEKSLSIIATFTDTFLAVSTIALLVRERSGYQRTNSMLQRIILYILGSGIIVGVCEIIAISFAFIIPKTFWYFAPAILLSRLYMNSILTLLNSRRSSRDSSGHAIGDPELSPKSVFLVKTSQGSLAV